MLHAPLFVCVCVFAWCGVNGKGSQLKAQQTPHSISARHVAPFQQSESMHYSFSVVLVRIHTKPSWRPVAAYKHGYTVLERGGVVLSPTVIRTSEGSLLLGRARCAACPAPTAWAGVAPARLKLASRIQRRRRRGWGRTASVWAVLNCRGALASATRSGPSRALTPTWKACKWAICSGNTAWRAVGPRCTGSRRSFNRCGERARADVNMKCLGGQGHTHMYTLTYTMYTHVYTPHVHPLTLFTRVNFDRNTSTGRS